MHVCVCARVYGVPRVKPRERGVVNILRYGKESKKVTVGKTNDGGRRGKGGEEMGDGRGRERKERWHSF